MMDDNQTQVLIGRDEQKTQSSEMRFHNKQLLVLHFSTEEGTVMIAMNIISLNWVTKVNTRKRCDNPA